MTVSVVTDSATDIPRHEADALGITVVPHSIRFGTEQFLDGVDLPRATFYDRLLAGDLPATSQPAVGAFIEAYESARSRGTEVLSIQSSRRLTGTVNAATAASHYVPDLQVRIVDSRQISMGAGLIVLQAARAAAQGAGLEDLVRLVADTMPRVYVFGVADSLEYALRGGRIGAAAVLLNRLIAVKPIVRVGRGRLLPVGAARTRAKAMDRLMASLAGLGPLQEVGVLHADAPGAAEDLARRVAALHPQARVHVAEVGPAVGTHAGPGSFGAACLQRAVG